jgi:hypothetical protein
MLNTRIMGTSNKDCEATDLTEVREQRN